TVLTHDVNIYLDEAGQASTTVEMIDNGSFDNCEMATLVLDNMSFDCGNIGANTVVLTATDVSGNVSSASAVVTVIDAVLPTVLTQDATIYLDDFGQASITVEMIENGSFDNCDIATLSLDNMSFNCGNVGANTVVLTATDVNGNVNAATAMVTVIDEIAPIALCQNISVTLSGGSASITPEMVDNGSNDACGIASLDIDITSFDCSNIGDNPVVLTVTDNNGNISTCDAIVNVIGVIPSCEIDVELENDTYTGGDGLTIFMGYGPQALTAHVLAEGGGPFTYSWTGGGGFLSSTSSGDPVFSPTADGMYTLVCTVTNSFGCETICEVEICVMDIRAGGNGNNAKVYLCHVPNGNHNKAKTLKVSVNAVPGHLNNHEEDRLGRCDQECGSFKVDFVDDAEFASDHEPVLNVYPNPTSNTFSFVLDSHHDEFFDMIIYDHLGRQIMKLDELVPNDIIEFGEDLTGGVYYVNVIQGEYIETLKIIKTQ
ncbi:MAG: T9SS type A sorting domain-containing protein, partial [Bacteroidales bacterium]|nr:T9SS type A sorting domain-containing protein [Bacteroidales bacterium]